MPKGPSTPKSPRSPAPASHEALWPQAKRKDALTVRPSPTASTPTTVTAHKTFLRIHLHRSVMANMDLRTGDLVSVRTLGPLTAPLFVEEVSKEAYPAMAWPTADLSMSGRTVLVADGWRRMAGIEFERKVLVIPYAGDVGAEALEVTMAEVNDDGVELDAGEGWMREGHGWQVILENGLFETKYAFENMPLLSFEYKGVRRTFSVTRIVAAPSTPKTKAGKSTAATKDATAYKVLPTTTVTLKPPPGATTTVLPIAPIRKKIIKKTSETGLAESTPTKEKIPRIQEIVEPEAPSPPPVKPVTFAQIGGLAPQLSKLSNLLLSTLQNSHHFSALELTPFRGILLHGPPGTGKSLIMRAIPGSLPPLAKPVSTYHISGSVVGKYLGESEASIRKIFAEAKANQPSIIFIDEIDSIAPARVAGGETSDERVVATLVTQLDELGDGGTVVVAATNRQNGVHHALRRPGRLERELEIPRPDIAAREEILNLLLKNVKKGWLLPEATGLLPTEGVQLPEDDLVKIVNTTITEDGADKVTRDWANRTHGFVGADLEALVRAGVMSAVGRLPTSFTTPDPSAETPEASTTTTTSFDRPILQKSDIEQALKEIRPTAMRDIVMETPKVRWSDIGGQEEVKQRLREAVEWPLTHPEVFARLGGTPRKGLLLYGPPGCSKTLTAKALATESGLNFMPVRGPELLNMYVGESERAVREVFRKARAASPSIIFFDEIDALAGARQAGSGGGGGVNVLAALLNEMDGIDGLKGVIVLAATNRPEAIDPALMRPGRLETILYVGPPDFDARMEILRIKTRKMAVAEDVDLNVIAELTDGYSGAELVNICDEAIHYAMREDFNIAAVAERHFHMALEKAVRQITTEMKEFYESWSVGGVKKI